MKIAICGPICSGKTFLTNYLKKKYNLKRNFFGDKVKDVARELFNMEYKDRKLIQTVADKMKEINQDVWVNYIIKQTIDKDNIIIEDLRFLNEAKFLQDNGFIIIKLTVEENIQWLRLKQTYPTTWQEHLNNFNHNSERNFNLIKANFTIESDSNLINKVDSIIKKL